MNAIKNKRYVTRFFKNRLHAFYFFKQFIAVAELRLISLFFAADGNTGIYLKQLHNFYRQLLYRASYLLIVTCNSSQYRFRLSNLSLDHSKLYWRCKALISYQHPSSLFDSLIVLHMSNKMKANLQSLEIDNHYNEFNSKLRSIHF